MTLGLYLRFACFNLIIQMKIAALNALGLLVGSTADGDGWLANASVLDCLQRLIRP